jgi:8-oxo-dGTP diphosphatase
MYTYKYAHPAVTVDCVIFSINSPNPEVLLIKRRNDPFKGLWALPGGFVDMNEILVNAAKRELFEETSLDGIELTQLSAFDRPGRDPREWTLSIAFTGVFEGSKENARASSDARELAWFTLPDLPRLAFDHEEIVKMAVSKLIF